MKRPSISIIPSSSTYGTRQSVLFLKGQKMNTKIKITYQTSLELRKMLRERFTRYRLTACDGIAVLEMNLETEKIDSFVEEIRKIEGVTKVEKI